MVCGMLYLHCIFIVCDQDTNYTELPSFGERPIYFLFLDSSKYYKDLVAHTMPKNIVFRSTTIMRTIMHADRVITLFAM